MLRFLRLRRRCEPELAWLPGDDEPDIGVREPRRPRPLAGGGAATLELPTD